MRKIYSIFMVAAVMLSGCTDNEMLTLNNQQEVAEFLGKRSYEEALQIAQSSISMIEDDEASTRSTRTGRTIDMQKTKVVKSGATRAEGGQDTLFYVFNFADEQGFAVVSANAATEGLIAVTEEANYDDCLEINDGFADYMKMAEEYVSVAKVKRGRVPFYKSDTLYFQKGPFLNVKWGQNYPEAVFFPNAKAGCSNVAIAQIFSYFNYPTQISLSYANADSTSINLEWNSMKAHQQSYKYMTNDFCSDDYYNAHSDIAHLCRQIAYLNNGYFYPSNVNYNYNLSYFYYHSSSYTSVIINNAKSTVENLGYTTSNITSYSSECTFVPLNHFHLVYMRGDDFDEGGHA